MVFDSDQAIERVLNDVHDDTNNLLRVNTSFGIATTPTFTTVTTTTANWTLVATGLSDTIKWKLMELTGSDFYYAYTAIPGNNFGVAFGWAGMDTSPSAVYIKRTGSTDITIKFERWTA